jgi:hypothetical protein
MKNWKPLRLLIDMAKAGVATARDKLNERLLNSLEEDGVIVVSGFVSPLEAQRPVDAYFIPAAEPPKYEGWKAGWADLKLRVTEPDLHKAQRLDDKKKYVVLMVPADKMRDRGLSC